ncbi:CDP-alcohol phosphatidyltransferase family protein [Caulobacter mirabilis]|uniref:CDP-diacylglycerol--glycerol-3-phosphate 3-phosphatidyltransferase n=1 Tax=Caulobacter mirabilis TaxID=69666 RepID=A0A2D2B1Z7_9CAUL|nr:CDP-alcohol phosphatidyltransferase family protein [Caulobacter mirabilis]ATQ44292.1 CDP-diacylglycerol--glycerol-3-phosphate 3-phosphatidyltransferase [Caulobacter mirabilis]
MTAESPENRRPLKTRSAGWAGALAAALGRARVSPDTISFASIAFAVLGAGALGMSGFGEGGVRVAWLLLGALCIQLRLLANMLDGMVAVEHGLGGPAGPIWNELPDRVADAFFLVAAGYGAVAMGQHAGDWLGWIATVLAILTAYVRELGRGLGFPADFRGPMAKPHRMFVLTVACLVSAAEPLWDWRGQTLIIALALIAAGSLITVIRRTARLAAQLRERG